METGRLVQDRFDRSSPVARTVDELDAWAIERLLGKHVARVEVVERTDGTTQRARLRLTGEGDLPRSVFVKLSPIAPTIRFFTNLANLGSIEIGFYRDIRPGLPIDAPQAIALAADPRTKRFVIVIEDLKERGARFGDAGVGLDVASAGALVDTRATLHGTMWESPRLRRAGAGDLGWVLANSEDPQLPLIQKLLIVALKRLARRDSSLVSPDGERIVRR